jgi:hypothetical protein
MEMVHWERSLLIWQRRRHDAQYDELLCHFYFYRVTIWRTLEEFVDKFAFTKFDPSGFVEHPNIKSTTSIVDFIFRVLGYEYLGRTDLVHVLDKPEVLNTGADDWDEVPSNP